MQRRNFLSATLAGTAAPAWEFDQFLDPALKGVPPAGMQTPAPGQGRGGGRGRRLTSPEMQAQRLATEREDLEVSIQYTKKLISI